MYKMFGYWNMANNRILNYTLEELSDDEWNKKFSNNSIHELCSHIYVSDFCFLKHFKSLRKFKVHNKEIFGRNYNYNETFFKDIKEYISMREELDKIIVEFLNELNKEDLSGRLEFTNSRGENASICVDIRLIELYSNQMHHRGMISSYLDMLGKENDFVAYI